MCAIALAAAISIYPQNSVTYAAGVADGITIGVVAAMEPHKALSYALDVAATRGLELGKTHGDAVLNCLQTEFVEIKQDENGKPIVPRGMKAAIQLVHRHNNNGGAHRSAAKQIRHIVDLVAERACGVSGKASQ